MRTTGITVCVAEVMKASRAACASASVNGRSMSCMPSSSISSSNVVRVTPGKISTPNLRVMTAPEASTIQALLEAPSVTKPVLVDEPGFARAVLARGLLGEAGRQQHHRLDVATLPADVGHRLH